MMLWKHRLIYRLVYHGPAFLEYVQGRQVTHPALCIVAEEIKQDNAASELHQSL